MDNYVGKRLDGRYEIQEIIGVGGMAVVYKAYDNIDDRIVAVKILKDEFLANEEFRRRFKNESKAIAVLNHPNIVRVYDVNFGERLQYIVMEYVDGITLKEYIQQQGTVNWKDALHFISQILRALQHAHDKGIVHRDIKPQNIMLLQNGNIKMTDFGIARFSRSDTRTMTEKAIGSVHYISPEQARGDMTDEKADIYSVGVVLYEMLTGTVPFESDSAVSVAIMQLQAEPTAPTAINPAIPKGLEQITMHAMQKLSVDRYQTATEMLLDIEEIIRNPNATFDYSYFVDSQPTRFVSDMAEATGEQDYPEDTYYDEEEQPYADQYEEFEEYPDNTAKNKKMIAAISAGVLLLITAIVLLIVGLTGGFSSNKVNVPDLVGKDYTKIAEQYKDTFEFEVTYVEETLSVNSITEQDPEKGTKVKKGSTIKISVVKGSEEVPMPDVVGMTLEDAKKVLAKENLNMIEIKEIPSEEVEIGKVISSSPEEGIQVSNADKIILYVSSGSDQNNSEKVAMPDCSGLTRSAIRKMLDIQGFTNYTFKTENSDLKKDEFISQNPSRGTMITKDTKITIIVSSGEKETEKPTEVKRVTLTFDTYNGDTGAKEVVIKYNGKYVGNGNITMDGKKHSITISNSGNASLKGEVELEVIIDGIDFRDVITVDFDNPDSSYVIKIPEPETTKPTEEETGSEPSAE